MQNTRKITKQYAKYANIWLSNLWATFKVRPWLHNKTTITTTKTQQLSNSNSNNKICESLWGNLTQANYLPYSEINNGWHVPYLIFACLQQKSFSNNAILASPFYCHFQFVIQFGCCNYFKNDKLSTRYLKDVVKTKH